MKRIDELLLEKGFAESRAKAKALLEEGIVFCGGILADKPSRKFDENVFIEIVSDAKILKFVSRAGLKLDHFLTLFNIEVSGLNALDAGASTGGFTDCLLQRGINSVLCVEIGHSQLHPKILTNPKITNLEKTDIRNLQIPEEKKFDFICADLSFISLDKVLDKLWTMLAKDGTLVCLVKPQFEVSMQIAKKNKGILKDSLLQSEMLEKIESLMKKLPNADFIGNCESPILGGSGNKEFLTGFKKL